MKLKKLLAALLCITQVIGATGVWADNSAQDTQEAETVVETELPLGDNELRVYVSCDGSDSNSGSFDKPVKSISKGVELGKSLKASNPTKTVTVNIRGGEYSVDKAVDLTGIEGTLNAPLVIQSYNDEEVILNGATKLNARSFSQLTDKEVLSRIPQEARKYIGVYDLSSLGSKVSAYTPKAESLGNNEFIVDGNRQTIARWPNSGFDRTTVGGTKSFQGTEGSSRSNRWKTAKDPVATGYFGVEYMYEEFHISSMENGTFTLSGTPMYSVGQNMRYSVKNLLEEIDEPGEYYIDASERKLYWYPTYPIAATDMELVTAVTPFFSGKNVKYVTIKGIEMKNTRASGIEVPDSYGVTIDDCEIKNVGVTAVVMENCTDCKVINSTISGTGMYAIRITGGDRQTLTPSNNLVDNNHIYQFALNTKTNTPGISLEGVGGTITHNLIHSSTAQGVLFSGNDHKINYNEMYNLVNEPTDAGAIYAGRNYTMRGNEIAYNYIHDIDTTADKGGSIFVAAVYMDDLFSSSNIHHNVIYNCNLGVMIGGGRYNSFDNNILIDCENGMFMDARGVGWGAYHAAKGGQAYNTISQVPYNKSPYKDKYPELASILDEPENLGRPVGNSIQNNVMYNCLANMVANEMKQYGTVANNYEVQGIDKKSDGVNPDTIFEDYYNNNFNLKDGSDIAKKYPEAASIDMSEIGLRSEKAEEIKAEATERSFKTILPLNGQTDISNISQTFQWEKLDIASKYVVRIADDPEMQNVIMTHETKDNVTEIQFIPSGGKAYWWTVTGVSESKSLSTEFSQYGVPKLLISTLTEKTDKTDLRANIDLLNQLYNNANEGTTPGTYKAGFKAKLKTLIDDAEAANASETILQKDIIAINNRADELIDTLVDNLNYKVVNVGDLLKDESTWVYQEDCYTFNSDGSLTLKGEDGTRINHYTNMIYDKDLGDNVAIKFGYKVNVSSNYCIIGLQNDATFLNGGYDIIVKSNALEIQRHLGYGNDGIESTDLNFYVSDDKWVDLELGALKTGIGTYVYLKADGQLVTSFLDRKTPYWSGASKFVFGNPSGESADCYAEIRPAAE